MVPSNCVVDVVAVETTIYYTQKSITTTFFQMEFYSQNQKSIDCYTLHTVRRKYSGFSVSLSFRHFLVFTFFFPLRHLGQDRPQLHPSPLKLLGIVSSCFGDHPCHLVDAAHEDPSSLPSVDSTCSFVTG